jgi:hypothetical protein
MNKFIASTARLSICFLTSCSIIEGYRQDPSTWGKKEQVKNASDTADFPKQTNTPLVKPTKITPSINSEIVNKISNNGRTVEGMIEPDVTQLPDNKDLQESNNVAPAPLNPKLRAPVAPLLINPSDSLPLNR